jgi:LacI family transcriptional regulator
MPPRKPQPPRDSPAPRPNIRLIAREAGVSPSTVSRFLNGNSYVSAEARRAIARVIQKHDYRPSLIAQGLARGKSRLVGAIATDAKNPITGEMIQGLVEQLGEHGYSLLVSYSQGTIESEEAALQLMRQIHPAAMVVFFEAKKDSEPFVRQLQDVAAKEGIPIILAGDRPGNQTLDCLTYDSEAGAYLATRHLLQSGFQEVGCVTGSMETQEGRLRFDGFRRALVEENVPFRPEWVHHGHFEKEDGYRALHAFHKRGSVPRALVCCNDTTALGVYLAAEELGIAIPGQLAVIGCDNIELSRMVRPRLSTVSFNHLRGGDALLKLLLDRLADPAMARQRLVAVPVVVERESTRRG